MFVFQSDINCLFYFQVEKHNSGGWLKGVLFKLVGVEISWSDGIRFGTTRGLGFFSISAVGRGRRNLFPWIERVRVWSVWKSFRRLLQERELEGSEVDWRKSRGGILEHDETNWQECGHVSVSDAFCVSKPKSWLPSSMKARRKANVLCQRVLSCHVLLAGPWLNGILKFHNCNFETVLVSWRLPQLILNWVLLPPTHVNPV